MSAVSVFYFGNIYLEEDGFSILWCKCGAFKTKENRQAIDNQLLAYFLSDPLGARTQDPNIKSVVLYQLS